MSRKYIYACIAIVMCLFLIINIIKDLYARRRKGRVVIIVQREGGKNRKGVSYRLGGLMWSLMFSLKVLEFPTEMDILHMSTLIIWGSMSILYLYKGFVETYICEDGVYTNDGIWKWDQIGEYKWNDFNGLNQYDELIITVYPRKFEKNPQEVGFNIKHERKEKLDQFLHTVIKGKGSKE